MIESNQTTISWMKRWAPVKMVTFIERFGFFRNPSSASKYKGISTNDMESHFFAVLSVFKLQPNKSINIFSALSANATTMTNNSECIEIKLPWIVSLPNRSFWQHKILHYVKGDSVCLINIVHEVIKLTRPSPVKYKPCRLNLLVLIWKPWIFNLWLKLDTFTANILSWMAKSNVDVVYKDVVVESIVNLFVALLLEKLTSAFLQCWGRKANIFDPGILSWRSGLLYTWRFLCGLAPHSFW